MTSKRFAALALLLTTTSTAAFAGAAEDAATVENALKRYFGSEPGALTVAPAGDDVAVTLDPAPFLKKMPPEAGKTTIAPFQFTLHNNGDGTWKVGSNSTVNVAIDSAGLKLQVTQDKAELSATFDESLGGMTQSRYAVNGLKLSEVVTDPNMGEMTVTYNVAAYVSESTTLKREPGVGDLTQNVAIENIQGTWTVREQGSGAPKGDGTFSAQKGSYKIDGKGLRTKAILDLIAWFVAHPSKDLIVRDQAELKAKISSALPIFEIINATQSVDAISIQTPIGPVGLQNAKIGIDIGGLVKDGRFGESVEMAGLTIPQGIAPPWSTDLIPTGLTVGFLATGFDADAPGRIFIDKMDLSKDPPVPPDVSPALAAAAMPGGKVTIAIPATSITAPAYTINMTGGFDFGMAGPLGGKLDVKMKGLDTVMAKLQEAAANDPQAAQAIAGIVAAKGMAKAEADGTSSWAIVYTPDGKITVNGIDMMGMAPPAQ